MATVPISEQGATELETLANSLKQNSDDIAQAGETLSKVVDNCKDGLGVFAEQIESVIAEISQKQKNAVETVETLSTKLTSLAARIREIAAML